MARTSEANDTLRGRAGFSRRAHCCETHNGDSGESASPEAADDAPLLRSRWKVPQGSVSIAGECGRRWAEPKPVSDRVNQTFPLERVKSKRPLAGPCWTPFPALHAML